MQSSSSQRRTSRHGNPLGESAQPKEREEDTSDSPPSMRAGLGNRLRKQYQDLLGGQASGEVIQYHLVKLYLTERGAEGVRGQHELQQLEKVFSDSVKAQNIIEYHDLFQPSPTPGERIRTVLLKGIAGVGKTTGVQKFVLDWADAKLHQDIDFVLPVQLSMLTLIPLRECSLIQLLGHLFPELTEIQTNHLDRVLLVLDGLSECRLSLDFQNTERCCDPMKRLSLTSLLTNLLRGDLLPSALLLVISRPSGQSLIPAAYIQRVVEMHGLDDVQWEENIRRRITDPKVAAKAITHVKASRGLYIMRPLPVFCGIAACVLGESFQNSFNTDPPQTLTDLYTHYLLIQVRRACVERTGNLESKPTNSDMEDILTLAKLAWHNLKAGKFTILQCDLRESSVAVEMASEFSIRYPSVFTDHKFSSQGKGYCFVHPSIQEYLAALHVHMCYGPTKGNVMDLTLAERAKRLVKQMGTSEEMLQGAVDRALKNRVGQLDRFLVFLMGITVGSSSKILPGFFPDNACNRDSLTEEMIQHLLKRLKSNPSPEGSVSLTRCLEELDVPSPLSLNGRLEFQKNFRENLSPSQWCAKASALLTSEEPQEVFDMTMFQEADEALLYLLPVIKASRVLRLDGCMRSNHSLECLAAALSSPGNSIRELDLGDELFRIRNAKVLCAGLESPHCKLEVLSMPYCFGGNKEPCPLIAALTSNPSHLRELALTCGHHIKDDTMNALAKLLIDTSCNLEKLKLQRSYRLTKQSYESLATALRSRTCTLRELDLSETSNLEDEKLQSLAKGLADPCCTLETLRLGACRISPAGFSSVVSALHSNPVHLRELDLSSSSADLSNFKELCSVLKDPRCGLQALLLGNCTSVRRGRKSETIVSSGGYDDDRYEMLASALTKSKLRVLDLSLNMIKDSSVKMLCAGLGQPQCKLEILRLARCDITGVGVACLVSALHLNPSHIRELDLSYNTLDVSCLAQLNAVLQDPNVRLEKLIVDGFGESRDRETLQQYGCHLTFNPDSASVGLEVTEEDREVRFSTHNRKSPTVPDHPERFGLLSLVMCREGLSSQHYCEIEWFGTYVSIGLAYKDISRKLSSSACLPGHNSKSWAINVHAPLPHCLALHNGVQTKIRDSGAYRVGVYLDWAAGSLSFYDVTDGKAKLMHSFYATFTQPLYMMLNISAGALLLPKDPEPVNYHYHDPWDMLGGLPDAPKAAQGCSLNCFK